MQNLDFIKDNQNVFQIVCYSFADVVQEIVNKTKQGYNLDLVTPEHYPLVLGTVYSLCVTKPITAMLEQGIEQAVDQTKKVVDALEHVQQEVNKIGKQSTKTQTKKNTTN